jgi:hypothetical protein
LGRISGFRDDGHEDEAHCGQLSYARSVDYTDIGKVKAISGITQTTENRYISQGAAAAQQVCVNYGCNPGTITNIAISRFSADVNASKASYNQKIAQVKSNKQGQYAAYMEKQIADALRKALGIGGNYSDQYILDRLQEFSGRLLSPKMGSRLADLAKSNKAKSPLEKFLDPAFLFNFFMSHRYETVIVEIIEELKIAAPEFTKYAKGIIQDEALTPVKLVRKAIKPVKGNAVTGLVLIPVDVYFGVVENLQQGVPTKRVISDAIVDAAFGFVEWAIPFGAGILVAGLVQIPNPYVAGAVVIGIDIIVSLLLYYFLGIKEYNEKPAIDWAKDRFYEEFFE